MSVKKIFVCSAAVCVIKARAFYGAKLHFNKFQRVVAVKEPCPEIDFPAEAPARSVVASALKSSAAGGGKLGSSVGGYEACGVERIEVRAMPVVHFNLGIIVVKFKKLTVGADFEISHF